jgi:hypothetical protein
MTKYFYRDRTSKKGQFYNFGARANDQEAIDAAKRTQNGNAFAPVKEVYKQVGTAMVLVWTVNK